MKFTYKVLTALILLLLLLLIFQGPEFNNSNFFKEHIKPTVKTIVLPILNSLKGLSVSPKEFDIYLKKKSLRRIRSIRDQAIKDGFFIENKGKYFPGKLEYDDEDYKIKIRLKGDLTDHLQGIKWSYRIKVLKNKLVNNMASFSIQHPNTRNFIYEWIFHKALKREGLIALDYDFISVNINDEDFGVYAMEEHFNDQVLKKNNRKPGPILKFSEEWQWKEAYERRMDNISYDEIFEKTFFKSQITGFHLNEIFKDSIKNEQYLYAVKMLESFRKGVLNTSEVFDIDQLAKFYALCDVLGAQHATAWRNARYYFNNSTQKLEPIGYDGNAGEYIEKIIGHKQTVASDSIVDTLNNYHLLLFKDLSFRSTYNEYLYLYSDPSYIEDLLTECEGEMKGHLELISSEFPRFTFRREVFDKNKERIRTALSSGGVLMDLQQE